MTPVERPCGAPLTSFPPPLIHKAKRIVLRLQGRIAKAWKSGRKGKAKALQRILVTSGSAKLLAVHKVATNKGAKTPGVDGVLWNTLNKKTKAVKELRMAGYKSLPLRRIMIPKSSGNGMRPLGIPTMRDRAMQALFRLALEPISETMADPNSYGFRPYRSCADAIAQAFLVFRSRTSPTWILEGDIKSCFDRISHDWILANVPLPKRILKTWLKSGFMLDGKLFPTNEGTPQGGIISPTIANMVLDGIERVVRKSVPVRGWGVHVIRYADDFLVSAKTPEVLTDRIMPALVHFLGERGLALNLEKTMITHVSKGADFLGQSIRKYKRKLLIKPSKGAVKSVKRKIREIIKKEVSRCLPHMVRRLNHVILGWGYYHRHVVSKVIFHSLDDYLFRELWRNMRNRHGQKTSRAVLYKRYWGRNGGQFGVPGDATKDGIKIYLLRQFSQISILRHVKIRCEVNPYLPEFQQYLKKRPHNRLRSARRGSFDPAVPGKPVDSDLNQLTRA